MHISPQRILFTALGTCFAAPLEATVAKNTLWYHPLTSRFSSGFIEWSLHHSNLVCITLFMLRHQVGDIVNLSARLMVAAGKSNVGILCDRVTFEGAQHKLEFTALTPIMVKGKSQPIDIFQLSS